MGTRIFINTLDLKRSRHIILQERVDNVMIIIMEDPNDDDNDGEDGLHSSFQTLSRILQKWKDQFLKRLIMIRPGYPCVTRRQLTITPSSCKYTYVQDTSLRCLPQLDELVHEVIGTHLLFSPKQISHRYILPLSLITSVSSFCLQETRGYHVSLYM